MSENVEILLSILEKQKYFLKTSSLIWLQISQSLTQKDTSLIWDKLSRQMPLVN